MTEKPKILVIGPVFNTSGYSEHARLVLDALMTMENEVDLYLQNTQWAASSVNLKYQKKYNNLVEKTMSFVQQLEVQKIGHIQIGAKTAKCQQFEQNGHKTAKVGSCMATHFFSEINGHKTAKVGSSMATFYQG